MKLQKVAVKCYEITQRVDVSIKNQTIGWEIKSTVFCNFHSPPPEWEVFPTENGKLFFREQERSFQTDSLISKGREQGSRGWNGAKSVETPTTNAPTPTHACASPVWAYTTGQLRVIQAPKKVQPLRNRRALQFALNDPRIMVKRGWLRSQLTIATPSWRIRPRDHSKGSPSLPFLPSLPPSRSKIINKRLELSGMIDWFQIIDSRSLREWTIARDETKCRE